MAVLTISREFGSGGREIGQAISESLGYEYVDKDTILQRIRSAGQQWEKWGKNLDEHCPTVWEKYDWSFRGFGALIQSTLLEYAVKDRVVLMGRGAGFLLAGIAHTLRIRVVAPLDARIERVMRRESLDEETSRWLIEKTDRDRACFLYSLYGKKWDDPMEYDYIFDTSSTPLGETVERVKELLAERDRARTDASMKLLRMRMEAAKIKAALLTDSSFFLPTLDVFYDGKDIILRGVVHNPKEQKRVEETARKLAGNLPLKCRLHYR